MKNKNILLFIITVFILSGCNIENKDLEVVTLEKCVDGDTAIFKNKNNDILKTRFLFIDTPEYTKTKEYGKEASEFTCSALTKANEIKLEYDGDKIDKYGRNLAWVWVDNMLLQEELAKNGFIEKYYDYGTYKYENKIRRNLNDKYKIFEKNK